MDTVLFTDYGIVVFAITASAMALVFSVLGLATTHQTRSDIHHQLKGCCEGLSGSHQNRADHLSVSNNAKEAYVNVAA
jgi:uncharacterized protein (DUF779 family)